MQERLAKESIGTLLALADMLPGALYRCRNDPDWTMDFLSAGIHELTGYSVREVVDERAVSYGTDMIVAEDQARVWEVVQAGLTARSKWEIEYRIRRRDGQVRWVWEQGHGVFSADGSLEFLVGYILEIEDRKRAEALLGDREAELARKNAELEAVSTPVLEVADHTLVVPLIGELTASRDARLLEVLLPAIVQHKARWLLIDITGLTEVAAASAASLVKLVRAALLLGARCILTGVQPRVARVLVGLDVSLGELRTAGSLKDGLALRQA
ncbi:PAS domain S-box-containing protein [Nannocystis exedens]|uniref:PAS domain S-box-containing protein n=1 Tax=Nannocystis exedens TaxID=54 RepID=A0A1I2EQZ8_9BACT|nr:PAS domain-containing protein [Nannocystis exedens]PCC73837.1 RsbT co-antagonist protein RsbRA [Nannocystis exedens]SFE95544.1 PAS domain S-box-containing protein [Nannocystis exedens]